MSNLLVNEKSLYLQQHANNPVNWHPYSDAAFEKAKKEDKPLVISIGYSSCHWCHVMEKNVFEHTDVADIMNENFICIKVDREERPDVDHIYMDAVQALTGRGGWPLNVFVMPDGRPFYGGTYFPKDQWISLIERLSASYRKKKEIVTQSAEEILSHMKSMVNFTETGISKRINSKNVVESITEHWNSNFDPEYGGEKGAPKFPKPQTLQTLLKISGRDSKLREQVLYTLHSMAAGGIYDQVGGGFARYSVDNRWQIPHFEKMLYDNAQLLGLYAKATAYTDDRMFRRIVNEVFEFLINELRTEENLFGAAIDADLNGQEGLYYTWRHDNFTAVINNSLWTRFFHVLPGGNWDGTNVLYRDIELHEFIDNSGYDEDQFYQEWDKVRIKLYKLRSLRDYPAKDQKAVTAWNAMTASSLFDSFLLLQNDVHKKAAMPVTNKILDFFSMHKTIPRILNYDSGEGFLDDYAFASQMFYKAYLATFEQQYLDIASSIFEKALSIFAVENSSLFSYSPNSKQLFTNKIERFDHVIPSSNAVMAYLAFHLGYVAKKTQWTSLAGKMIEETSGLIEKYPLAMSAWVNVVNQVENKIFVTIKNPKDALAVYCRFKQHGVYPDILPGDALSSNKKYIVCKGFTCFEPVAKIDEALYQATQA